MNECRYDHPKDAAAELVQILENYQESNPYTLVIVNTIPTSKDPRLLTAAVKFNMYLEQMMPDDIQLRNNDADFIVDNMQDKLHINIDTQVLKAEKIKNDVVNSLFTKPYMIHVYQY